MEKNKRGCMGSVEGGRELILQRQAEGALRSWHLIIYRKTIPFKGVTDAKAPRNRFCGRGSEFDMGTLNLGCP